MLVVPNVFHVDSKEITKEEFEAKFEEVKEILTNLSIPKEKKCKGCNCTITEGQFCQGCCVDGTAYGKKWSLD